MRRTLSVSLVSRVSQKQKWQLEYIGAVIKLAAVSRDYSYTPSSAVSVTYHN